MWEKKKISAKEQCFNIYCCSSSWWNWKFDKIELSKGMTFTLQCEVYMYSKTSQGLHYFFSRNAYCLVTDIRICRIEKVDWEMSGSQATDVWLYTNQMMVVVSS